MDKQTIKPQLRELLQKSHAPITFYAIADALNIPKEKQRSLRRWLHEMVAEQSVQKLGRNRDACYQIAEQSNPLSATTLKNTLFTESSQPSVNYIRQPIYLRAPKSYDSSWLESYRPNQTYYLPETLRKTLWLQGQQGAKLDPAMTFLKKIHHRLLIDLSYNSSRLEGNTYSLLATEKLVLEGIAEEGKLDEEKIMILNHKEAICYLIEKNTQLVISEQEIFTLHYLLADSLILPQYVGKIRDAAVRIYSSTYVTLEGKQQLSKQLELICRKASMIEDPFEQSFFLLVHLAYLQAFIDVNKRTSRLCANISLIRANLVPLSFNGIDKEDYITAMLAVYELNDVNPLVDLYYFSYLRTCQEYSVTLETVNFDEVRARHRQKRRALIRHVILNKLTENALTDYVNQQIKKEIPSSDQAQFKKNVFEDLEQMDSVRIVGLGITLKELEAWIEVYNNNA